MKMIARLLSAVFYIITRKLLGAFYVDQKKKGLLPSTLPSEHEQWGSLTISSGLNFGYFNYPLVFTRQATGAVLTHMNNNHSVYHAAVYLDSISRCALYGESTFMSDTKFYIIAVGD